MNTNVTPTYQEISSPTNKTPLNVLRAFIHTNKAFAAAIDIVGGISGGINEYRESKDAPTALDIPTYQQLPSEFLELTPEQKNGFILNILSQGSELTEKNRDAYVAQLFAEAELALKDDLKVEIPSLFTYTKIHSLSDLRGLMDMHITPSKARERLYHCMLMKVMFVLFVIDSAIDVKNLSKITTAVKERIRNHDGIRIISENDLENTIDIAYTIPKSKKPRTATIKFGEKKKKAIVEKMLRKPDFRGPEIIGDLVRNTIIFHEMDGNSNGRAWLIGEISKIVHNQKEDIGIETNTPQGEFPVIGEGSSDIIREDSKFVKKDIPGILNIQVTGPINPKIPKVRGVNKYEVMGEFRGRDWNKTGAGERKTFNIERLQKAFSRLSTGGYGVLKVSQVKYALENYAQELGSTQTAGELFNLLLLEKRFLIPINMVHGTTICYRVTGIYDRNPLVSELFPLEIEDLDMVDNATLLNRLIREFDRAKTMQGK